MKCPKCGTELVIKAFTPDRKHMDCGVQIYCPDHCLMKCGQRSLLISVNDHAYPFDNILTEEQSQYLVDRAKEIFEELYPAEEGEVE